jgi:hypothetical protein
MSERIETMESSRSATSYFSLILTTELSGKIPETVQLLLLDGRSVPVPIDSLRLTVSHGDEKLLKTT